VAEWGDKKRTERLMRWKDKKTGADGFYLNMKNFITIGLCIALPLSGISCKSQMALSKNEINQFGDKLTAIIQHHDTAGFVALLPKPTDQIINVVTKKPIEEMAFEENDEVFRDPNKVARNFESAMKTIESLIGNAADAQCSEVQYLINQDVIDGVAPFRTYGVLQFDIILVLYGNGKTCTVGLDSAFLCKRGVLIATDLHVQPSK
jgi:hypothetical protein